MDNFTKKKWTAFEIIMYQPSPKHKEEECILIGVNFEDELLELRPLIPDNYQSGLYDRFWTRHEYCRTPRMKPIMFAS